MTIDRIGGRHWAALIAGIWFLAAANSDMQTRYLSGQTIAPVYEGWEQNADGSFDMYFGYLNRNYEEHVEIPIGSNNNFSPAGPDRGQPTYFYPRRQSLMFKVTVPKDWGKQELVWTLTVRGHTEQAVGSLLPIWNIGEQVFASVRGGSARDENKPPSVKLLGPSQTTAAVGQSVALTADVIDDGVPGQAARRRPQEQSPQGQMVVRREPGVVLGMTWLVHRGQPGGVLVEPRSVAVKNGRAETKAIFRKPGAYVLRGYADDGVRTTPVDVTVTVTGHTSS